MIDVVIVGAGFAGLYAAKRLCRRSDVNLTIIDRENHHLFQQLLYQVAMAALSPADIAAPIRSLFSARPNVRVIKATAQRIDIEGQKVITNAGEFSYDYVLIACGAQHAYFGNERWEPCAPGLKTLAQATEIRRRVLEAFEAAEREPNAERRRCYLTFAVVGGGPTGVELAGAIGEMSRYTLARDFRSIDPRQTRVVMIEAGPRILPTFDEHLAARAMRDLESIGVQVWTSARVTDITSSGVNVGSEQLAAATVLWAAGVRASPLGATLGVECDRVGRVPVGADLALANRPNVFVCGDQSRALNEKGEPLPGTAAVAAQEGAYVAKTIVADLKGRARKPFRYHDRGNLATIGRARAVAELGPLRFKGRIAWWFWLIVHVYYLNGLRNRSSVLLHWAWSYFTFGRGARLIVDREWRAYAE